MLTVDNRLDGPTGNPVTDTSLASSAGAGTVTVADAGTRAVYDDTVQVVGRTTVEAATGHHRQGGTSGEGIATPRLLAALPSAPWTIRVYTRVPGLQVAGHGTDEVRWLLRLGDSHGLLVRESSSGNIQLRVKPWGLASSTIGPASFTGTAPQIAQVLRVELSYDGTDLEARVYEVGQTTAAITYQFTGLTITGSVLALTGYRFRDGVLLQPGDNDANLSGTPVEDRQNQLLVWDPNILPNFGADGDYGQETTDAVTDFQNAFGLLPVDGEVGPETGAALDLMVQLEQADPTPPPLWLSHLAVDDTATVIGPAQVDVTLAAAGAASVSGQASTSAAEGPVATAMGSAPAGGTATASKSVTVAAAGSVSAAGAALDTKNGMVAAEAAPVRTVGVAGVEDFTVPIEWPPTLMVELHTGEAWEDITGDVRTSSDVSITRGRADEASSADPGKLSLLLNNRHGRYSPRNPVSPYYGRIGRNTPIRVRVGDQLPPNVPIVADAFDRTVTDGWGTADTGQEWERLGTAASDYSVDAAGAHLTLSAIEDRRLMRIFDPSIPADVDLVFTASVSQAPQGFAGGAVFAAVAVRDGVEGAYLCSLGYRVATGAGLRVTASISRAHPDGNEPLTGLQTVTGLTYAPGELLRVRVRAVGPEIRMRVWADGADEPMVWHAQAHDDVVTSGGYVSLSGNVSSSAVDTPLPVMVRFGEVTAREAAVPQPVVRFSGEVSAWPARWDLAGADVWVPIEGSGLLRRLGQGSPPGHSPLRRTIVGAYPLAYWPLEDGATATRAASAVGGVAPLTVRDMAFGEEESLPSSLPLPTLGPGARFTSQTLPHSDTGVWSLNMLYLLPDSDYPDDAAVMLDWATSGTAARWVVMLYTSSTDGVRRLRVVALDADGGVLALQNTILDGAGVAFSGQWRRFRMEAWQDGADVRWRVDWLDQDDNNWGNGGAFAGQVGRVTRISTTTAAFNDNLEGMAIGHLSLWGVRGPVAYYDAFGGFRGETARSRIARLAAVEGVPLLAVGAGATPVGALSAGRGFLDAAESASEADMGILDEQRDRAGLRFRARESLYNQEPTLILDYTEGVIGAPFEPVEDDQALANDITAKRDGGSEFRAVQETGPLSVADPPDGVGRYEESVTLDVAEDTQLPGQAGWRLHLGTVDEVRYPTVRLNLANPRMRERLEEVLAIDAGDRVRIVNLPAWMPPGGADLIVQGYTETIGTHRWEVELTCTPASPWTVGAVPELRTISEGFEDSDYTIPVTAGGDAPWERTTAQAHGGFWSLVSGPISHGQTSDAVVAVPAGARTLRFWYRVSSEENFDELRVLVDTSEVFAFSGYREWAPLTLDVEGAAEVVFRYAKDASASSGEDRAWIDDITFTFADAVSVPDAADRADTAGAELRFAVDSAETTLAVDTTAVPPWITSDDFPDDFPFDVVVGGEVMRVTQIIGDGNAAPQSFVVERSTNGIVKPHPAGADVRIAHPMTIAL
ncbi:peptidoglycan-binding domain-containing protein [Nocardiopsis suaedae]|uniref:Peptidoglycan-binding domain-containing protein n=1 Tax=Nocardiopsis suaedae TaxID=3018444 RepID=A0ABT4TLX2_9ACTN|nr:peptidoglycan-binding domain-containing protein [Nocardiopsis suaedae]MDA2805697.1 peptidoglycan-binding domain-containing protein [Nocardiopsis suaedae]